jgi:regulator of sigma E protease
MPITMPLLVLATATLGIEIALLLRAFGLIVAARRLGVEISHINVGFGRTLCTRTIRRCPVKIRCVPLGVFVSIPAIQVRSAWRFEGAEATRQGGRDRLLISISAITGSLAAVILAAVLIWAGGVGEPVPTTSVTIGDVPELYTDADGAERFNPEWLAGLRPGDEVLTVNGLALSEGWGELTEELVLAVDLVTLRFTRQGSPREVRYRPAENPNLEGLRYPFFRPDLRVEILSVAADSPAEEAGLMTGDILLEVDDVRALDIATVLDQVQSCAGRPIPFLVERQGKQLTIPNLRPRATPVENGNTRYTVGVTLEAGKPSIRIVHPMPWQTVGTVLARSSPLGWRPQRQQPGPRPRHMSGPIGALGTLAARTARHPRTALAAAAGWSVLFVWVICITLLPFLDAGRACIGLAQLILPRRWWLRSVTLVLCLLCLVPPAIIIICSDAMRAGLLSPGHRAPP